MSGSLTFLNQNENALVTWMDIREIGQRFSNAWKPHRARRTPVFEHARAMQQEDLARRLSEINSENDVEVESRPCRTLHVGRGKVKTVQPDVGSYTPANVDFLPRLTTVKAMDGRRFHG